MKTVSPTRNYAGFTEQFRAKAVKYALKHGQRAAAKEFGVSPYAIHRWFHRAGHKPRSAGAPRKNKETNAR